MKKQWQAPALEVLDVKQTMAGVGAKYIDYIFVDKDGNISDIGLGGDKIPSVPVTYES